MPHPIQLTFSTDDERRRSRLQTFFIGFMLIPHIVVMYVYQLIASLIILCAWFITFFSKKNSPGLHDFTAGYLRYQTRIGAYALFLVGDWPPFPGNEDPYPVNLTVAPPEEQGRFWVLFRGLAAIPAAIILMLYAIPMYLFALLGWFAIIITGRMPEAFQSWGEKTLRYATRLNAYSYFLTATYPKADDDGGQVTAAPTAATPAPLGAAGPIS